MSEIRQDLIQNLPEIHRNGNFVTITKPNDHVYTIAYGKHNDHSEKGTIPNEIDMYDIEGAFAPLPNFDGNSNQKRFVRYAEEHQLPIISTEPRISLPYALELYIAPTEFALLSIPLFIKIIQSARKGNITRRDFVKNIFYGLSATYFSIPQLTDFSMSLSYDTGMGENQAVAASKFSKKIHPEVRLALCTMRDVVTAHKLAFLSESGFYQHPLIGRGALHIGLEEAILADKAERLDLISRLHRLLPKVLEEPGSLYKIQVFKFQENLSSWSLTSVIEVPELKTIIEG